MDKALKQTSESLVLPVLWTTLWYGIMGRFIWRRPEGPGIKPHPLCGSTQMGLLSDHFSPFFSHIQLCMHVKYACTVARTESKERQKSLIRNWIGKWSLVDFNLKSRSIHTMDETPRPPPWYFPNGTLTNRPATIVRARFETIKSRESLSWAKAVRCFRQSHLWRPSREGLPHPSFLLQEVSFWNISFSSPFHLCVFMWYKSGFHFTCNLFHLILQVLVLFKITY